MIPFHLVFPTVVAVTMLSGAAATAIAVWGDPGGSATQRKLVERLSQITLLGAGTIFALMSSLSSA